MQVSLDSNTTRTAETFSLAFTSATQYILRNESERLVLDSAGTYVSGTPILFEGLRLILTDTSAFIADRPKSGDSLLIGVGVQVVLGTSQTVLPLQPLSYGTTYATSNGVIFSIGLADTLPQSITYRGPIHSVDDRSQNQSTTVGNDLAKIKVVPNPYLVSSRYEEEFGILVKEPIRQLKFNNLPAVCTIRIFTMAGDKSRPLSTQR